MDSSIYRRLRSGVRAQPSSMDCNFNGEAREFVREQIDDLEDWCKTEPGRCQEAFERGDHSPLLVEHRIPDGVIDKTLEHRRLV